MIAYRLRLFKLTVSIQASDRETSDQRQLRNCPDLLLGALGCGRHGVKKHGLSHRAGLPGGRQFIHLYNLKIIFMFDLTEPVKRSIFLGDNYGSHNQYRGYRSFRAGV
jgi:hypothetical protein